MRIVDLNTIPLSTIHAAILQHQNLSGAAAQLEICSSTLQIHLAKSQYKDCPLSFHMLKNLSEADARKKYQTAYDQPLCVARKIDLKTLPLSIIHAAIIGSKNIRDAALTLGVYTKTLQTYLGKLQYLDQVLTYEILKGLDETRAREIYLADYDRPFAIKTVHLKYVPLSLIHAAILHSKNLGSAAASIGVAQSALESHLNKSQYYGEFLSYDILKRLNEASAREIFQDAYDQPLIVNTIKLTQIPLSTIHAAIRKNSTVQKAASSLGVWVGTLQMHLGKSQYNGQILSYDILKFHDEATLYSFYKEDYYKPLSVSKKIELKRLALSKIHEAILQSNNVQDAAASLGVSSTTLESYLGRSQYFYNQKLSYDILKHWNSLIVKGFYGEAYDKPLVMHKVNLNSIPLSKIHEIIRQSHSPRAAAAMLGVSIHTLQIHLNKAQYQCNGLVLSYELLKEWDEMSMTEIFQEAYHHPLQMQVIDLKTLSLARIHQAILNHTNSSQAAASLGVYQETLQNNLKKVYYQGQNLSYEQLKAMDEESARAFYQDVYTKPLSVLEPQNTPRKTPGFFKRKRERDLEPSLIGVNSLIMST